MGLVEVWTRSKVLENFVHADLSTISAGLDDDEIHVSCLKLPGVPSARI